MKALAKIDYDKELSQEEKDIARREFFKQLGEKRLPFYGALFNKSHPRVIFVYKKPKTVIYNGEMYEDECYLASVCKEDS